MFILNRRNPVTNMIGSSIGFVKEYNADRKGRREGDDSVHEAEDEDDGHEWAQAIDQAQQEGEVQKDDEKKSIDDLVAEFIQRYPPPPYVQQQPVGTLTMPVILPQRRPESRTRGFVRGYAPVLEAADVEQQAWFDFLDGFEKSINKNNLFWAANAAVWVLDKAYIATMGVNIWVELVVLSLHLSIEGGRRGYIHAKQNKYLDETNEKYFKPRGLYALIVKYKPDDLNDLGEWVDIRQNVTQTVTKRDDPERSKWKNILNSSSSTTKHEAQLPEFAPLIFPKFDDADEKQKESAAKHFQSFMAEYSDRQANARFDATNPESKLANVAPQKEWASRYSNPEHPARQGGLVALVSGGKYNPQRRGLIRGRGKTDSEREAEAHKLEAANRVAGQNKLSPTPSKEDRLTSGSGEGEDLPHDSSANIAKDGVDRNEVAWQATLNKRGINPMRRLLKQDVLYLLVVNMPTPEEIEAVKRKAGITEW